MEDSRHKLCYYYWYNSPLFLSLINTMWRCFIVCIYMSFYPFSNILSLAIWFNIWMTLVICAHATWSKTPFQFVWDTNYWVHYISIILKYLSSSHLPSKYLKYYSKNPIVPHNTQNLVKLHHFKYFLNLGTTTWI